MKDCGLGQDDLFIFSSLFSLKFKLFKTDSVYVLGLAAGLRLNGVEVEKPVARCQEEGVQATSMEEKTRKRLR